MTRLHLGVYRHFSSRNCAYQKLFDKGFFEPRVHRHFGAFREEKLFSKGSPYPESGIYEIANGCCIAGNERLYLKSGRLIGRLQSGKNSIFSSLKKLAQQSVSRLDGTLLHISLSGLENNYYHFNVEYLARLFLFIRSGLQADYYLIPNNLPFQRELHEIIGIETQRILTFESGQLITAKKSWPQHL